MRRRRRKREREEGGEEEGEDYSQQSSWRAKIVRAYLRCRTWEMFFGAQRQSPVQPRDIGIIPYRYVVNMSDAEAPRAFAADSPPDLTAKPCTRGLAAQATKTNKPTFMITTQM